MNLITFRLLSNSLSYLFYTFFYYKNINNLKMYVEFMMWTKIDWSVYLKHLNVWGGNASEQKVLLLWRKRMHLFNAKSYSFAKLKLQVNDLEYEMQMKTKTRRLIIFYIFPDSVWHVFIFCFVYKSLVFYILYDRLIILLIWSLESYSLPGRKSHRFAFASKLLAVLFEGDSWIQ